MNKITSEQKELIVDNLISAYTPAEIAYLYIGACSQDEIDRHLEALCACEHCRVCGTNNSDCIACDEIAKPCNCNQ